MAGENNGGNSGGNNGTGGSGQENSGNNGSAGNQENQNNNAQNSGNQNGTPPWGNDFDPQRAWDTIQNLRRSESALKQERDGFKSKVDENENSKKSVEERLTGERDTLKSRAETAEFELMRMQVGAEKGLKPSQVKRLQGKTKEELEADADELIKEFGGNANNSSNGSGNGVPSNRPEERYRGGGDDPGDTPVETDPSKLADSIRGQRR